MLDDFSDFGLRTSEYGSRAEPARRWETVAAERSLLAVARTGPATRRVLDLLAVVEGDPRVSVTFAHDPGSALGGGVRRLLQRRDVRPIPLGEAVTREWDAALTASPNGPLPALARATPTFLVPHGVGHGKALIPGDPAVSGLAGRQLLHEGAVVPAAIGLAHDSDVLRLARHCPPAAAFARVVGDPCWDRLAASRHRRAAYREAFGIGDAALLVLSSTWGPAALFARHHDLPARLTAELPWDQYRVALILHPAVWGRHGTDNIERWLRPALDRGLLLLDPDEEWRAALVAADAVVGDHGSVALYAAAAGTPVALAAFGWAEVDPASAIAGLGRTAPGFDAAGPLERQVAALVGAAGAGVVGAGVAGAAESGGVGIGGGLLGAGEVADRLFAHQGESLTRICEVVYELLDLPAPARRLDPIAVPLPRREPPVLDACFFHAVVADTAVTVTRRPVSDLEPPPGARLLADVHAANPRHPAAATVLVRHGARRATDLADHPAAYVAAAVLAGPPRQLHLALRGRGAYLAELAPHLDPALVAAAAHALVFQAGLPIGPELVVNGTVVPIAACS